MLEVVTDKKKISNERREVEVIYSHLEEKASIVQSRVYKTATNKKWSSGGVDLSKDRMTALVTSGCSEKTPCGLWNSGRVESGRVCTAAWQMMLFPFHS
jgi:hypothetical protein